MQETGPVETRVSLRRRKPPLSRIDLQNSARLIQAQSDITIHEIREAWKKHMQRSGINNLVFLNEWQPIPIS